MNVTDPTTQAASTAANDTQPNSNTSQPTPRLWDMRWFGYLSGPLLFGTIIVPLIAGPTTRFLFRSWERYRGFWRVALIVFWFIYFALYYALGRYTYGSHILSMFSDLALMVLPVARFYAAMHRHRGLSLSKKVLGFVINYDICILLGAFACFFLDLTTNFPVPWGALGWVAVFLYRLLRYFGRMGEHTVGLWKTGNADGTIADASIANASIANASIAMVDLEAREHRAS